MTASWGTICISAPSLQILGGEGVGSLHRPGMYARALIPHADDSRGVGFLQRLSVLLGLLGLQLLLADF